MTSPSSHETPAQLAGFPESVRNAYETYRATGDPEAAQIVVFAALRDFLPSEAAIAPDAPLEDSMSLADDLGYDSVAIAEIVFFIEDVFQVTLQNQDLKALSTVGDLRAFVARKLSEKTTTA